MLHDLVTKNRSYRRFYEDFAVSVETLRGLVELARLSPSSANLQPLKYILSYNPQKNALIFPHLMWAGYLKDWQGPGEGERPSAYIIILGDTRISANFGCDHGIAAQSMLLGAAEMGLGGCMVGSINREGLHSSLNIPMQYEILLAIAIGKPREKVIIDNVEKGKGIKYWRDNKAQHHVPKRTLDEIILTLEKY